VIEQTSFLFFRNFSFLYLFFISAFCHLAAKSLNLEEKKTSSSKFHLSFSSFSQSHQLLFFSSFSPDTQYKLLRSNFSPSLQPDKKERNNKERPILAHNAHASHTGRKKSPVFTSSHLTKIDRKKHLTPNCLKSLLINSNCHPANQTYFAWTLSEKMFQNIKVQLERMGSNNSDDESVYQQLYNDESTHAPEGRVFYLSRHGESEFNLYGKIGVSISHL